MDRGPNVVRMMSATACKVILVSENHIEDPEHVRTQKQTLGLYFLLKFKHLIRNFDFRIKQSRKSIKK